MVSGLVMRMVMMSALCLVIGWVLLLGWASVDIGRSDMCYQVLRGTPLLKGILSNDD